MTSSPWRVVKLEMTDGSPPRFTVQFEDGSYFGQAWDGNARSYRCWKSERGAQRELERLRSQRQWAEMTGRPVRK